MPIEQIDPKKAYERMSDSAAPAVYLDVRTPEEFSQGHAKGAQNVPVMILDENGQMTPNENFVNDVGGKFSKDTRLVVGCKMGGRGQRACELLEAAGFTSLANIVGGFSGKPDGSAPGWQELGLPVE